MKNKAIYIIMVVAVVLGSIMIFVKGFNYGILYSKHERLEIIIGSDIDLKKAKKIVDENIKTDHITRKATLYGTTLVVDSKKFKEEEINKLLSKLNESYSKDYSIKEMKKNEILIELNVKAINDKSDEEIQEIINQIKDKYDIEYTKEELLDSSSAVRLKTVAGTSAFDMIKNLFLPLGVSLLIVMVYFSVRYHKLYKNAFILEPLKLAGKQILNQLFILSIIAIIRIPVAAYLPAFLVLIWIIQLLSETLNNERKIKEKNQD